MGKGKKGKINYEDVEQETPPTSSMRSKRSFLRRSAITINLLPI